MIILVCSKCIEIEAVFTKTEMKNEWNINFFQNCYLGIYPCPNKFSIGQSAFCMLLSCTIVFILIASKTSNSFTLRRIFRLGNKKKVHGAESLVNIEGVAVA